MADRTSLYDMHAAAGATFTEFAGFEMPVHYGSIKAEHMLVREKVGLFDVSHMSNLWVEGPGAAGCLSAVTPKDAAAQPQGKGWYTVVLRDDGTIVDDTFCFRIEEERFLMIPNAGMGGTVQKHLAAHAPDETMIADESKDWAILALQGPRAPAVVQEVTGEKAPKFREIHPTAIADADCLVSGTGYTGEKGVEIYVTARAAESVWSAILEAGDGEGIGPVGLGARDTLRLEKGFCLAGNEFAGGRTPVEANLAWLIDWDHDFLGKDALQDQKDKDHDLLLGLVMEKGIPRPGYSVKKDGGDIGSITSGTQSPVLGKGIALAYLRGAEDGDAVDVDVRGKGRPATVQKPPFV